MKKSRSWPILFAMFLVSQAFGLLAASFVAVGSATLAASFNNTIPFDNQANHTAVFRTFGVLYTAVPESASPGSAQLEMSAGWPAYGMRATFYHKARPLGPGMIMLRPEYAHPDIMKYITGRLRPVWIGSIINAGVYGTIVMILILFVSRKW